jgi:hypothetical protein
MSSSGDPDQKITLFLRYLINLLISENEDENYEVWKQLKPEKKII